jgi:hypothetical protein
MDASFDCFLAHNSRDKPAIRALHAALAAQGLDCWLDELQVRPGLRHLPLLEEGIRGSRAVAVCVGADGLGPWQAQEMEAALTLATKDPTLPVMPVLLPDAPAAPELPLFLAGRGWVDLRDGLDGAGWEVLLFGITGEPPSTRSRPAAPAGSGVGTGPAEAPIPSERRFADSVFEQLHAEPGLVLLAQADRPLHEGPHAALKLLRERAEARFGAERVLHLVPPGDPHADEAHFFGTLAQCAGAGEAIARGAEFEAWLARRLAEEPLFLLISDLGHAPADARHRLAAMLRSRAHAQPDRLKVLLVGGEELAALMASSEAGLSPLNHLQALCWPELNAGDVLAMAARAGLRPALTPDAAARLLTAAGGHPRLIIDALREIGDGDGPGQAAARFPASQTLARHFRKLAATPEREGALRGLLDADDHGPFRDWIRDDLIRGLYWRNLLRVEPTHRGERLVWRCEAVREAGRRALS